MTEPFSGFTPKTFDFFIGLGRDNSKSYWEANKPIWERHVRAPLQAMLAAMPAAFQPFHIFRMHRDVRFSPDKSPYKMMSGAANERPDGTTNYTHISTHGLLAAAGQYTLASDQVARLRAAIAAEQSGTQLSAIVAALAAGGLTVGPGLAAPLKTAPRGYAADHPRIELLRWKGCMVMQEWPPDQCTSAAIADRLIAFWASAAPLNDWLGTHVGPTTQPPTPRR